MKSKLPILFLIVFSIVSTPIALGQTVNTTFATQINTALGGLDKSRVPHKLLKDQAMEFAELGAYNGVLTTDNLVHRDFTGNPVLETATNEIDLTFLKPGMYILKAIINNEIITKKVMR